MMPRSERESRGRGRGLAVDRRSYLKLAGVTAASAGLLSGPASASFTRRGIRFNRTVNMVDDAGCDPTGDEPCDDQITGAADDYTLLKFPEGEYRITETNTVLELTNVGFLGVGDVRFTVPENFNDKVLLVDRGTGVLFEGIDIDQRADGATPSLHIAGDDDIRVHDVELIGQGIHPDSIPKDQPGYSPGKGAGNGNPNVDDFFYPIVRSESGTALVTELHANNHGLMGTYNAGNGRSGIWVSIQTKGTITFKDCHIEEFGSNGCYTSRTYGVVQYEGGTYRNNDNNQIRLGSEGSYIDGAILEVDADESEAPNPDEALNYRGARIEMGHNYSPVDVSIRNCDISIRSTPHTSGGIVAQSTAGHFEVKNTRIGIDPDGVRAVYAYEPDGGSYDPPPKPRSAVLDNVSITGEAAGNEAVRLIDRPDSVVKNCCIQQTGGNRDGVVVEDTNSTTVRDSTINVTGRQVVDDNASVSRSNLSHSGSCTAPITAQGDDLPHKLSFVSDAGRFTYSFAVSGDLGKSTVRGASLDPNDTVTGSTASGQGNGGTDSYGFSGELLTMDFDGDATVYLDGDVIDPDDYSQNILTLQADGGRFSYTLAASGDLVKSNANGASVDDNDEVSGSVAVGQGGEGGLDSYAFSGALVALDVDGDARVTLNGERVDPDDYFDNVVTITGSSVSEYTLAASGSLRQTGANGASVNNNDTVSGSTARGQVGGGADSYKFTGALVALDIDGDARVTLNGERVDPDDYFDNVVTIGGSSVSEYTLAASGSLRQTGANGASVNDNDTVSGSTARGQVGSGADSYKFSGALVVLDIDGDARVTLNGERVDPDDYFDNVVTIGGSSVSEYTLAASGSLRQTGANGASVNDNDHLRGSTASGQVGGGADSYKFTGALVALDVDGDARVRLNGERVDPDDYFDNVVTIGGSDSNAEYTLSTSGPLKQTGANNATVDPNDHLRGSSATGQTRGGWDSYKFSGDLQRLDIDGTADVLLNGEHVNPSRF